MWTRGNNLDRRRCVLLQCSLCYFDHLFRWKRLTQVLVGLLPYGTQQSLWRAVGGHDDDFRVGFACANPGKHLEAIQLWHPDVQKRQSKTCLLDLAQCFRAILHSSNRIAGFFQHRGYSEARCAVIIGDKNFLGQSWSFAHRMPPHTAASKEPAFRPQCYFRHKHISTAAMPIASKNALSCAISRLVPE